MRNVDKTHYLTFYYLAFFIKGISLLSEYVKYFCDKAVTRACCENNGPQIEVYLRSQDKLALLIFLFLLWHYAITRKDQIIIGYCLYAVVLDSFQYLIEFVLLSKYIYNNNEYKLVSWVRHFFRNSGTVESVYFSTERFQILKIIGLN